MTLMSGRRPFPSRVGFTLSELVTVMAIVVIIAAIGAPRYARSLSRYRVDAAARRISADLDFARREARHTSSSKLVTFYLATHSYEISNTASLNKASADYVVRLQDEPYQTRLIAVDFGGDATVAFDGFGNPDTAGFLTVQSGDVSKTVTLSDTMLRAFVQ